MRRVFVSLVAVCFAALAGCAPGDREVEQRIRDELTAQESVQITSVKLTKQPDSSYVGTATAENGDTYDLTVEPPRAGRIRWRATATQTTVERKVREGIDSIQPFKVGQLNLTKQSSGDYTGTVQLENGAVLKVTVTIRGAKLTWRTEPME